MNNFCEGCGQPSINLTRAGRPICPDCIEAGYGDDEDNVVPVAKTSPRPVNRDDFAACLGNVFTFMDKASGEELHFADCDLEAVDIVVELATILDINLIDCADVGASITEAVLAALHPAPTSGTLAAEYAALVTFGGEVGSAHIPAEMSERVIASLKASSAMDELARDISRIMQGSDKTIVEGGKVTFIPGSDAEFPMSPVERSAFHYIPRLWHGVSTSDSPAADEVEAVARAIDRASFGQLHVSEPVAMARAAIAALQARSAEPAASAWIVSNGNADAWRTWQSGAPEWTSDRQKATRYARRVDAEAVHAEDEDAWRVEQFAESTNCPAEPAGDEPVAWMYVYKVQYVPKMECTAPLKPVIALSGERWDKVPSHWSETPLYARPATPTNPERLVEALKPFARAAEWWTAFHDFQRITPGQHGDCLEVGHLRAAAAALSAAPLKEGEGE